MTRGVVSRIDFRPYAHSQIDSHLVIQIDAAINPGNSGGPVLQDGKVVGVAFQGLRSADNTGYMIPTPVVKRFLEDIKDGSYDHYVDLGLFTFDLHNPAMRQFYGLDESSPGVLVASVTSGAVSDGILSPGDILTTIDGFQIDREGNVVMESERVQLHEIVERKFANDSVWVEFIRQGKHHKKEILLKNFPPARIYSIKYEKKPRYTIQGGCVFQPLDYNLYVSHQLTNSRVRKLYHSYLEEGIHQTRQDIVILTQLLSDSLNSGLDIFVGNAIKSINGVEVRDLQHAHKLLNPSPLPEFFEIRFDGINRPLILATKELQETNARIHSNYGIHQPFNLEE